MRVCILTSVHNVWDTRIYHREAQSLAKSGYEVIIIATGVESQKILIENISIIGLKRPKQKLARPLNWLPFLRVAISTHADIYHFHDPDLLFVGFLLQVFTGKSVIYDNHDPYVEAIFQREWIPRWLRYPLSRVFDFIERIISSRLSAVIVANDSQQVRFPQAILVHNYPDLNAFQGTSRSKVDPSQIIHAGMLTEARGAFELVKIAELLGERDIKFLFLGPFANEMLESAIQKDVVQVGMDGRIQFEGRVPHEQIVSGLMESTIGLIPFRNVSNHQMIIPTKLFEYMACALPVVASDLPPIRQYVTEAGCGLLVSPENSQAFANAIEYLLDHPEEAYRMGQNGRKMVFERYNWETEEKKLLSLYRELLS